MSRKLATQEARKKMKSAEKSGEECELCKIDPKLIEQLKKEAQKGRNDEK